MVHASRATWLCATWTLLLLLLCPCVALRRAVPAGGTDQIRQAIAGANAGDVLVLDFGTYYETGTIIISKPVVIRGVGAGTVVQFPSTVRVGFYATTWAFYLDQFFLMVVDLQTNTQVSLCTWGTPYETVPTNMTMDFFLPEVQDGDLSMRFYAGLWYGNRRVLDFSYGICTWLGNPNILTWPQTYISASTCHAQFVMVGKREGLGLCSVVQSDTDNRTAYDGLATATYEEFVTLATINSPLEQPYLRPSTVTGRLNAEVDYHTGLVSQGTVAYEGAGLQAVVASVEEQALGNRNISQVLVALTLPAPYTVPLDASGRVASNQTNAPIDSSDWAVSAPCNLMAMDTGVCRQLLTFFVSGCDITANYYLTVPIACQQADNNSLPLGKRCPIAPGQGDTAQLRFVVHGRDTCGGASYDLDQLFDLTTSVWTDAQFSTRKTEQTFTLGETAYMSVHVWNNKSGVAIHDARIVHMDRGSSADCTGQLFAYQAGNVPQRFVPGIDTLPNTTGQSVRRSVGEFKVYDNSEVNKRWGLHAGSTGVGGLLQRAAEWILGRVRRQSDPFALPGEEPTTPVSAEQPPPPATSEEALAPTTESPPPLPPPLPTPEPEPSPPSTTSEPPPPPPPTIIPPPPPPPPPTTEVVEPSTPPPAPSSEPAATTTEPVPSPLAPTVEPSPTPAPAPTTAVPPPTVSESTTAAPLPQTTTTASMAPPPPPSALATTTSTVAGALPSMTIKDVFQDHLPTLTASTTPTDQQTAPPPPPSPATQPQDDNVVVEANTGSQYAGPIKAAQVDFFFNVTTSFGCRADMGAANSVLLNISVLVDYVSTTQRLRRRLANGAQQALGHVSQGMGLRYTRQQYEEALANEIEGQASEDQSGAMPKTTRMALIIAGAVVGALCACGAMGAVGLHVRRRRQIKANNTGQTLDDLVEFTGWGLEHMGMAQPGQVYPDPTLKPAAHGYLHPSAAGGNTAPSRHGKGAAMSAPAGGLSPDPTRKTWSERILGLFGRQADPPSTASAMPRASSNRLMQSSVSIVAQLQDPGPSRAPATLQYTRSQAAPQMPVSRPGPDPRSHEGTYTRALPRQASVESFLSASAMDPTWNPRSPSMHPQLYAAQSPLPAHQPPVPFFDRPGSFRSMQAQDPPMAAEPIRLAYDEPPRTPHFGPTQGFSDQSPRRSSFKARTVSDSSGLTVVGGGGTYRQMEGGSYAAPLTPGATSKAAQAQKTSVLRL